MFKMISFKLLVLSVALFVAIVSQGSARYIKKADDYAKVDAALFAAQRQSKPSPAARIADPIDGSSF